MSDRVSRGGRLTVTLLLVAPASLLVALAAGSVVLSPMEVMRALTGEDSGMAHTLVVDLRLPRAIAAFTIGGMLALAGSLLQVLLRNPLADPYVLGVSGGAAVGALTAILAGAGGVLVGGAAFGGALLSIVLVFTVSRAGGAWTPSRLLLTGVVIAAGWGACVSLLLALAPSMQLHSMLFWMLGDLSDTRHTAVAAIVLGAGLALAYTQASALNVLARGERVAATLGVDTARLRVWLYFLAAGLTATAVALAGSIGFVGLIVPHLTRLLGGSDHRFVLAHCVLLGGALLVVADTLARTLFAPVQLPVGVLTALLGVPTFLYLLTRAHTAPAAAT